MPRYVIHAGPWKTGTTYIQQCLYQNAVAFLQQGILVPLAWTSSKENPSHVGLIKRLNRDGLPELRETFNGWKESNLRTVVISCEAIAGLDKDRLVFLRDIIGSDDFVIVLYVRRWSSLIQSTWQENVKHGHSTTFSNFLSDHISKPEGSPAINLGLLVDHFIEIFGKQRIKLVSYDTVSDKKLDIFRHFSRQFLDAPRIIPATYLRANASMPLNETELIRALNHLDQGFKTGIDGRIFFHLARLRETINIQSMLDHIASFTCTMSLSDNHRAVREFNRISRAEYADCTVRPVPAYTFYDQKDVEISYISGDYALTPSFADVLQRLRDHIVTA